VAILPPASVPGLLRALLDDDPGRPRLTWYGPDGERIELSAKVLDNWVAKTANLLVDELDAGPGTRVAIALPPHWRTAAWLLAAWSTGACVVPVPRGRHAAEIPVIPPDADVLVACDRAVLDRSPARARQVAVALPSLATSFGPELPPAAVDAAVDIRSYGDVFVPFAHPAPGDPALGELTHGGLIPEAVRAADAAALPPRVRLLTGGGVDAAVPELLAPLVRLGSVVLHHDLARADPAALDRLRSQEGITAVRS
jgi:uncharacterized protein (TIGR03089 family)